MKNKWYNILPWIALFSGVLVVVFFLMAIVFKPSRKMENTINRKMVSEIIKQIKIENDETINSKAFIDYFEKTVNSPVVSTKWLISSSGEIKYANGAMAQSTPVNASIFDLVDKPSRGLIDAVEDNIDPLQKSIMYAAATIRREGEHNDVYGHLVMPLKTSSNELAGFIGVAYSLDNSNPPFSSYIIGFALVVSFLLYWLLLPIWVYFDSKEKNINQVLWTLFVLLGNIPALVAYLIVTKK